MILKILPIYRWIEHNVQYWSLPQTKSSLIGSAVFRKYAGGTEPIVYTAKSIFGINIV